MIEKLAINFHRKKKNFNNLKIVYDFIFVNKYIIKL